MINKQKLEIILPKFVEMEEWDEVLNDTKDSIDSEDDCCPTAASFTSLIPTSIASVSSKSTRNTKRQKRVIPQNLNRGFKYPSSPTFFGAAKKFVRPMKELLLKVVFNFNFIIFFGIFTET